MKEFGDYFNRKYDIKEQRIDEFFLSAMIAGAMIGMCMSLAAGAKGEGKGGFWQYLLERHKLKQEEEKQKEKEAKEKRGEEIKNQKEIDKNKQIEIDSKDSDDSDDSKDSDNEELPAFTEEQLNELDINLAIAQKANESEQDQDKKEKQQKNIDYMLAMFHGPDGSRIKPEDMDEHLIKTFTEKDLQEAANISKDFSNNVNDEDTKKLVEEVKSKISKEEIDDIIKKNNERIGQIVKEKQAHVAETKKQQDDSSSVEDSSNDSSIDDSDTTDTASKDPKNPKVIWKRHKNKTTGKPTKAYYNTKGAHISAEEYKEKVKRYNAKLKNHSSSQNEAYISLSKWLNESMC